jgi:hypothetical protein
MLLSSRCCIPCLKPLLNINTRAIRMLVTVICRQVAGIQQVFWSLKTFVDHDRLWQEDGCLSSEVRLPLVCSSGGLDLELDEGTSDSVRLRP